MRASILTTKEEFFRQADAEEYYELLYKKKWGCYVIVPWVPTPECPNREPMERIKISPLHSSPALQFLPDQVQFLAHLPSNGGIFLLSAADQDREAPPDLAFVGRYFFR